MSAKKRTKVAETPVSLPTVADAIRADLAAGDAGYRAAGEKFSAQKETLDHGQWLPWLKENGFSERTARRYMAYAKTDPGVRYEEWRDSVDAAKDEPTAVLPAALDTQAVRNLGDEFLDKLEREYPAPEAERIVGKTGWPKKTCCGSTGYWHAPQCPLQVRRLAREQERREEKCRTHCDLKKEQRDERGNLIPENFRHARDCYRYAWWNLGGSSRSKQAEEARAAMEQTPGYRFDRLERAVMKLRDEVAAIERDREYLNARLIEHLSGAWEQIGAVIERWGDDDPLGKLSRRERARMEAAS